MAKIPWRHIREAFSGEWVELVDYSWKGEALYPHAAIVRNHSSNRTELLSKIARSERVDGAVIIFVGASLPAFVVDPASASYRAGV